MTIHDRSNNAESERGLFEDDFFDDDDEFWDLFFRQRGTAKASGRTGTMDRSAAGRI